MPVYDYYCADCDHGFTMLRPMSESGEPASCDRCDGKAQRVISAPRLNTMRPDLRRAHQTNERSAHEPRATTRHRCGAGCNHDHSGSGCATLKQASSGKRPWMLGH